MNSDQSVYDTVDKVRKALRFYEKYHLKKQTRKAKAPTIRNYKLHISVGNVFLNDFPDIFGQVEIVDNHYVFSRAQFYKILNIILQKSNLRARRSGCLGFLEGGETDIKYILTKIVADGSSGNLTNISLHNYMSDMIHADYYHFIKHLYETKWDESFDQHKMTNFVLQTMIKSCPSPHIYTLFGEAYTLDTIPLPYLMNFTHLPIDTSIQPSGVADGMTPAIAKHFIDKMTHKIEQSHLLAYLNITEPEEIQAKGSIPVLFEPRTRNLIVSVDSELQLYVHGFKLNSSYSFVKTIRGNEEILIPDEIDHLFISCKKSSHCFCQAETTPQPM